jgi:ABC-type branched-subunit amino acid transport system permease subunit
MKHMRVDLRRTVVCLTLVALAGIPLGGEVFYTRLFTRIMLYAMVACSLDLILGYGGMGSCTCPMRINIVGSLVDRHRNKKV